MCMKTLRPGARREAAMPLPRTCRAELRADQRTLHAATGDEATVQVPRTCRGETKADQSNLESVQSCAGSCERQEKAWRSERGKGRFINAVRRHAAAFARAVAPGAFLGTSRTQHKNKMFPDSYRPCRGINSTPRSWPRVARASRVFLKNTMAFEGS